MGTGPSIMRVDHRDERSGREARDLDALGRHVGVRVEVARLAAELAERLDEAAARARERARRRSRRAARPGRSATPAADAARAPSRAAVSRSGRSGWWPRGACRSKRGSSTRSARGGSGRAAVMAVARRLGRRSDAPFLDPVHVHIPRACCRALRANGSVLIAGRRTAAVLADSTLALQPRAHVAGSWEDPRANANQDHRGQRSDRGHGRPAVVLARAVVAGSRHEQQGPAHGEAHRATSTVRPGGCSSTASAPSAGSPPWPSEPATVDALTRRRRRARGDAATKRCDDLVSRMKNAPLFERNVPTLVALVDTERQDRRAQQLEPEPRRRHRRRPTRGSRRRSRPGQSGSDVWYEQRPVPRFVRGGPRRQGRHHRRARHRPAAQRHALARQRGDDGPRRSSSSRPRATASRSSRTPRSRRRSSTTSVEQGRQGHAQERALAPADRRRSRRRPARRGVAAPGASRTASARCSWPPLLRRSSPTRRGSR